MVPDSEFDSNPANRALFKQQNADCLKPLHVLKWGGTTLPLSRHSFRSWLQHPRRGGEEVGTGVRLSVHRGKTTRVESK